MVDRYETSKVTGTHIMYKTITDEFIISTLSRYREEMLMIDGKLRAIEASLSDDTELIRAASLPGTDPDVPKSKNSSLKDLGDVYEKYVALARSRSEDCTDYVLELHERKDTMIRVRAAFENLSGREYQVLEVFCEKRRAFQSERATRETMHALYLSERTIHRVRRQALKKVRDLYESSRTLLDLQMSALDSGIRRGWEEAAASV